MLFIYLNKEYKERKELWENVIPLIKSILSVDRIKRVWLGDEPKWNSVFYNLESKILPNIYTQTSSLHFRQQILIRWRERVSIKESWQGIVGTTSVIDRSAFSCLVY